MHSVFITATDTDAGKTYVSALLLRALKASGLRVLGLKPIAAGVDADGRNADAKILQAVSDGSPAYELINPIVLAPPVAPHLAAAQVGLQLDVRLLDQHLQQTANAEVDVRLIEGAGGWLLPLSADEYLADLVMSQQLPVVLVVGMKLGCLNHALLTARELQRSGVQVLGWVANCVDPAMMLREENIADLTARLPWPRLAVLPYQKRALPTAEMEAELPAAAVTLANALLARLQAGCES
jgi:dethiobiotin synthetase